MVLDAAILLEAGWDSMVQEVWVTIIPPAEVSLVLSSFPFIKIHKGLWEILHTKDKKEGSISYRDLHASEYWCPTYENIKSCLLLLKKCALNNGTLLSIGLPRNSFC